MPGGLNATAALNQQQDAIVRHSRGRLLATISTREEHAAPSDDVRAQLVAGTLYRWSVDALDVDGGSILKSTPTAFTVQPASR